MRAKKKKKTKRGGGGALPCVPKRKERATAATILDSSSCSLVRQKNLESKALTVFEKDKKNMLFYIFFNRENVEKMRVFQFVTYEAELGLT